MYSLFLSSYTNTRESLGELEKDVETLACGSCSHSIYRSPKLPLVLVFNKLTSIFYASVLLLIMNFVVTFCQSSCGSADYFDNIMTKFIVNNRTDALKTDINLLFTITNCRIARSRSLKRRMNFKFMCLSGY